MSPTVLIAIHLVASSAFALVYRSLAARLKHVSRLTSAIMYLFVVTPVALTVAFSIGGISLSFSAFTWAILIIAGSLFSINNILAYKANSHLDAAQFTVISNLQGLFTFGVAAVFLGERLTSLQIFGMLLLVLAASVVSIESISKKSIKISRYSWLTIFTSLVVAVAFSLEKYLLGTINFASYLLVGWGFQTLSIALLAIPEYKHLRELHKKDFSIMLLLGALRTVAGLSIVAALTKIDVSIAGNARSFKVVIVFIAAFFLLHERKHVLRKFIGSVLAFLGLLLLL